KVQSELRELDREIALDTGSDNGVHHLHVFAARGLRLFERGDAFTEVVEGLVQPSGFDNAGGGHGFLDRFAGNETAREAGGTTHPLLRGEGLEGLASREQVEERFRRLI